MKGWLVGLLLLLVVVSGADAQVIMSGGSSSSTVIGSATPCTNGKVLTASGGVWICADPPGAAGGAPATAKYIVQTADATLSAEQALGALGTGIMFNTTTTGVVSIYGGAACTNQFIEDLDASGAPNCQSVSNAYITNGTITAAKLAFTPLASGDVAGGSLTGTYPNPTIANDAIALGAKTTGNYVGQLTAGTNIGLSNCTPGEGPNCTITSLSAPPGAQYWTGAADGALGAAKDLGSLATGLVINTGGTPSAYTGAACTNAFIEDLSVSGAPNCQAVTPAHLSFDPFTQAEADAHTGATTSVHGIPDTSLLVRRDGSVLQDKVVINDTDGTPIANKQLQNKDARIQCANTGTNVEERCIANTSLELINGAAIANDAVALGTKTTGNYVAALVAGTNITLDSCTAGEGPTCTINSTGGGGGGAANNTYVRVALAADTTPANVVISNPGTASFDTITLNVDDRVLLTNQSSATENGFYLFKGSGVAMVRTADFDAGAEFLLAPPIQVYVREGTKQVGTVWTLSNTSAITLGATGITFARTGPGAKAELLANKNAGNGYVGANVNGRVSFTGAGDFAAHSALSAATTITPTQPTMGIAGTGPGINLTSNPNIAAGTYHGQRLTIKGTDLTNTVILEDETIDAGSGINLCGRTGSALAKLGFETLDLEWNSTLSVWEEMGCKSLQRVANVGNTIDKTGTQLSLRDGTSGFDFKVTAGKAIMQCIASGADCDNEWVVPTGKIGSFISNATEIARLTQSTNAWDFLAGHLHLRGGTGAPTAGDCDASGEARRVWIQTDAAPGAMVWTCRGAAGWAQSGVTSVLKSMYIGAGAFEVDGTQCTDPAAQIIVASGPKRQTITCADNDSGALYTDFVMPDSWNAGTITVENHWFSASNLSTQVVSTDWTGNCVSSGDPVPVDSATGVQTANVTFGNQTNDERHATSAAITLNGSCLAGDHVYLKGRIRATATTATMTNVRFLGIKVVYGINAITD